MDTHREKATAYLKTAIKVAEENGAPGFATEAIIAIAAKELMDSDGLCKQHALLEASIAYAEMVSVDLKGCFFNLQKSTSSAIVINIEGKEHVLSLRKVVESAQKPVVTH